MVHFVCHRADRTFFEKNLLRLFVKLGPFRFIHLFGSLGNEFVILFIYPESRDGSGIRFHNFQHGNRIVVVDCPGHVTHLVVTGVDLGLERSPFILLQLNLHAKHVFIFLLEILAISSKPLCRSSYA